MYRHLRRKEYARLKDIEQKSLTEKLDDAFQDKLDTNRKLAEEKTAKKRAKRLKKKKNQKRPKVPAESKPESNSDEDDDDDDDEEEAKKGTEAADKEE